MKRIINTTESEIKVQINGNAYVLPASGYLDVSDEVCAYWRKNLHAFLKESEVPVKEVKEVKEVVKEEVKKVTKK